MANNLHISYDLKNPGQRYQALSEQIKTLGDWAKIQDSFWFVDSVYTASQARDILLPMIDINDSLYVVDATNGTAAWRGLSDAVSSHIRIKW